jgi:3-oxoacyl-[acyl-carrier protein] reductase
MELENRVAVITGGAGQIGQAVAQRLALQGARIFLLVRRNLEQADTIAKSLANSHLDHRAILVDVRQANQIAESAALIKELAGSCHILVNSAAIALHTDNILDFPDEQLDEIIATNLKGPWLMIKHFLPMLKESKDGLVVNISSGSSVRPPATSTFYSMTKAGLNVMTESLAKKFGPEVRFVSVAPSMLPLPISGYPFIQDKKSGPVSVEIASAASPLKRICTADDVANAVESLATKMKFYNGHVLILDGGTLI